MTSLYPPFESLSFDDISWLGLIYRRKMLEDPEWINQSHKLMGFFYRYGYDFTKNDNIVNKII